jgi:hypothetical protein
MLRWSVKVSVVPAKAGTHDYRLWNVGPRFRGDDTDRSDHTCRSTIMRLIRAMASAGLRLLGQALAQFMMVWQR